MKKYLDIITTLFCLAPSVSFICCSLLFFVLIINGIVNIIFMIISQQQSYNYEVFALHRCHHSLNWTIHGMWPEFNKSSWPSYCHHNSLNMTQLEPLIARLNQDWLDCYCQKNQTCTEFWSHEWTKHGTCSYWYPSQYHYFLDGLERYTDVVSRGGLQKCDQSAENCYFYWNPWNQSWII